MGKVLNHVAILGKYLLGRENKYIGFEVEVCPACLWTE